MSFANSNGTVRIILAALAVLATTSEAARAETIFLHCGESASTFTVDLTNNTVDNKPATINATSIDWTWTPPPDQGTQSVGHFHIDRIAGTLTSQWSTHFANGRTGDLPSQTWSCTVSSAPPTKF
jgi:hypothetical protein